MEIHSHSSWHGLEGWEMIKFRLTPKEQIGVSWAKSFRERELWIGEVVGALF